jgi:ribosomal protein S27AE
MSLYRKSWLFTAWLLLVFFSFPICISWLLQRFGETGMVIGGAFWLSHGLLAMFAFRCPECGLSPFLSNKGFFAWSTPWPRRSCGHCGRNHQAVEDVNVQ